MNMFGSKANEMSGEQMTAYFSIFVFAAVFNGFNVRSESLNILENIKENMKFIKVMAIIVVVQIVLTYVGGSIFNCTPIAIGHWPIVILLAATIIPVDMLRKLMFSSKKEHEEVVQETVA